MGFLNFSAYSAMVTNWVNPDLMLSRQDDMERALTNSNVEVTSNIADTADSLQVITEKIARTDPDLVYSRFYDSSRLLSGLSRSSSDAHFDITPYENRIIIPKLGKNIPLVDVQKRETVVKYAEMNDIFMTELKKWVVRYPGTAHPGEAGNVFIFGHSSNYPWVQSEYNDVFALIDTLAIGDEIIVYYNQQTFLYRMTDRSVVKPGDTDVLAARDSSKKEISLMTCWPVGTALERYIIFGELVENN